METPNASQHQELKREEVLRFIVEKEQLTKTLRHFGLSKDKLFALFFMGEEVNLSNKTEKVAKKTIKSPKIKTASKKEKVASHKKSAKATAKTNKTTAKVNKAIVAKTSKTVAKASKTVQGSKKETKAESKVSKATKETAKSNSVEKINQEEKAAKKVLENNKTNAAKKTNKGTAAKKSESEQEVASNTKKSDNKTSKTKTKTKGSEKKPRKTSRRQSSPRGRRAASFEPENYTYQRLLIYTDGAARGNPGESGAGVVLKTPEGEEVGRFGKYLGKHTNNYAEYQALLLGLHHAREFGACDITILSDSELLVRQLLGEYRVRAVHLRELFDQAKELLTLFDKYQVKRIGREKNAEADSMANRAIDEKL